MKIILAIFCALMVLFAGGCALILIGLGMVARAGQAATQSIAAGDAQGYSAGRTDAQA